MGYPNSSQSILLKVNNLYFRCSTKFTDVQYAIFIPVQIKELILGEPRNGSSVLLQR